VRKGLFALLALFLLAPVVLRADDDASPASKKKMAERRKALWDSKRYDETGFARMGPPQEGEWLHRFVESCQDEDDYKKHCANKRRPGHETIYLRSLGPLSPRAKGAIEPIKKFVEAFFSLPVKLLDEHQLPKKAFVAKRKQYDEGPIMKLLKQEVDDDALVLAALTDQDLFSEGLNFVFGVGSLEERVGVYSLHRFGGKEVAEPLYLKRAFQLVGHELGHILSLEHCVYYKCTMNGSNSLEESDDQPCHLCPVCLNKLEWNVGFDRAKRYRALAAVYDEAKLEPEKKWCLEQATRSETKPGEGEKKPTEAEKKFR
jgi:archaemetzincin